MKIAVFLFLAVCLAIIAISSANTKTHVVTKHEGAAGADAGGKDGKEPSTSATRFCKPCKLEITLNRWDGHQKSHQHKSNCSVVQGEGVSLIRTSFRGRLATYRIEGTEDSTNVKKFLQNLKNKTIALVESNVDLHDNIKVGMELFGRFLLQSKEAMEVKSFNSKFRVVSGNTDLEELFDQTATIMDKKAIEFQEKDSGKFYSEDKAAETGEKTSKHDRSSTKKGHKGSDIHRSADLEQGGKKHKHVHADKHESFHKSGGQSAHGAKFEEASKRNKANFKKGFKEQFHKDELKKHDSFFSDGEKSGSYNIFGKKGSKYGSESGAKAAGGSFKSLKAEGKHGKGSKKASGHNKAEKKAHKSSKASKSSYAKGGKHGRKGGKKGGKQYKQQAQH